MAEINDGMYMVLPDDIKTLQALELWKDKFDQLTQYQRIVSNDMSIAEYGEDNEIRYRKMKDEFNDHNLNQCDHQSPEDHDANNIGDSPIIKEGYIKSDPDIYYNKDKFDSGEINLCFITGLSGSGKSTMAGEMSKENISLDDIGFNYHFSDENLKEYGDLIYSFFKGVGKKYRFQKGDDIDELLKPFNGDWSKFHENATKDFVNYAKSYSKSHKNEKFIIEGVQLYCYIPPHELKDYAVYIKGTSAIVSWYRALKRDIKQISGTDRKMKAGSHKFGQILKYFTKFEPLVKEYRDYFTKLMNKPIKENVVMDDYFSDGWDNKIFKARLAEKEGLVILVDTQSDKYIDEDNVQDQIDRLQDKWESFNSLSQDMRDLSDQTAYSIFGIDNYNLYVKIMNIYLSYMEELMKSDEVDSVNVDKELYESKVILPYYTPKEMMTNTNKYSTKWYLPESYIKGLQEYYYTTGGLPNVYEWCDTIEKLEIESESTNDKETKDSIKQTILELGWNPEIPFSREMASRTYLKRAVKPLEEVDLSSFYINEVTNKELNDLPPNEKSEFLKNKIVPIFVVLVNTNTIHSNAIKWFTDSEWSHVSIGFDSSLRLLYTFGLYDSGVFKKSGFKVESINDYLKDDKNCKIKVYALFVTPDQRQLLSETVAWYMENKEKTKYDFADILRIVLRKTSNKKDRTRMICSQFVYSLLQLVNFRLRKNKNPGDVTPRDIDEIYDDARFIVLFNDKASEYNKKAIDKMCYELLAILPLNLFGIGEALDLHNIGNKTLEEFIEENRMNPHIKELKPISFISKYEDKTPKQINESVENLAHNILYD